MTSSYNLLLLQSLIILGLTTSVLRTLINSLYDSKELKFSQIIKKQNTSAKLRKRPVITIAVIAQDDEIHLNKTIKSILKCRYRNLHIVIIDNASTDNTRREVNIIIKNNPNKRIELIVKRKREFDINKIFVKTVNKRIRGDLYLQLNAGDTIEPNVLLQAIYYVNMHPEISGLMLNTLVRKTAVNSFFGLINYLNNYLKEQNTKALQFIQMKSTDTTSLLDKPTIYSAKILKKAILSQRSKSSAKLTQSRINIYYASNLAVHTDKIEHLTRHAPYSIGYKIKSVNNIPVSKQSLIRHFLLTAEIYVLLGFFILSIFSLNSFIFGIGWVFAAFYFTLALLRSNQLILDKAATLIYMPLFYISSITIYVLKLYFFCRVSFSQKVRV